MPLPENVSIGKVFNKYGNDFETERQLRDLSIQQRNRNITVLGFSVLGGIAGYFLGNKANLKNWAVTATTILGGAIAGATISMLTHEKYNRRKIAIQEKREQLEQVKYLSEIAQKGLNEDEAKTEKPSK
jgi:outer membrane lipoprotein SlyB